MTALIIHGHFYQPPRENPWTGEVQRELSAAPYHDWNERIHDECYGPNAYARIEGNEVILINNYEHISFNFGPTLLSWLERHHPQTYERVLAADRGSAAKRGGHGNAIAQAYGHAILPLCNDRDQLTQVVWGLADFRYRFGRDAESLWLPETAANDATLSLLIDQGLRYVILAPEQASRIRGDSDAWVDLASGGVDTTQAYRYMHHDGSGRSLAVFFYNGPLARAIAFERALASSRTLVDRFMQVAQTGTLVNVATDGETYGHHFKFGDLCLAHALEIEAKEAGFWITNYGEYLEHHPPEFEVEVNNGPEGEGTSWSCAHGVGRWSRDCGCHTGGEAGWNQGWRGPLRAALDFLRDNTAGYFESLGTELLRDPWAARNAYIQVVLDEGRSWKMFLNEHASGPLSTAEEERVLTLLEIQRNALLMFTSCGWFFSDLAGIETIQIMKYAARVMELQELMGIPARRAEFLEMMAEARSNVPEKGNGAEIFSRFADPLSDEVVAEPTIAI
jgi:alpha-amylase/alpha-mannosidase (GH57 family)